MSDDSEEKTLAPSDHKLRKSREKGQIAASADFVTAMLTLAGVVVVFISVPSFIDLSSWLLNSGLDMMNGVSNAIMQRQLNYLVKGLLDVIAPLAIILGIVAFVANVVHKKGIPISIHPIKPDFNRINPAKGLKKLFGMRNSTEFLVTLFRVLVWFTTAIFIIWISLPDLISSPLCGIGCLVTSITKIAQWLFISGCVLLIAFGLVDLPMQVALFKRDQRMSHSEQKREMRDIQGSPEIKKKRRQLALEGLAQSEQNTNKIPGIFLLGEGCIVEIRYASGKTPLPIVVNKASGSKAYDMLAKARLNNSPVEEVGKLAYDLYLSVDNNMPIKQEHFAPVANALVKNNII